MNTKTLMEKLADKSPFWLAWAVMWRMWVLIMGFYVILGVLFGMLIIISA